MTEQEICEHLYAFVRDGARSRRNGTGNRYKGGSLAHVLSSIGWVQEDLRLALMRSDINYCMGQAAHEEVEP